MRRGGLIREIAVNDQFADRRTGLDASAQIADRAFHRSDAGEDFARSGERAAVDVDELRVERAAVELNSAALFDQRFAERGERDAVVDLDRHVGGRRAAHGEAKDGRVGRDDGGLIAAGDVGDSHVGHHARRLRPFQLPPVAQVPLAAAVVQVLALVTGSLM